MTEFDKWYKNSGSAWSFPSNLTNEAKFKVAWKAALKWVLTGGFEYNPKYGDNTEVVLANRVEKELEE